MHQPQGVTSVQGRSAATHSLKLVILLINKNYYWTRVSAIGTPFDLYYLDTSINILAD